MKKILLILLLTSFTALGQVGTPTYNPFNNGGMMNNGFNNNRFNQFNRGRFVRINGVIVRIR